MLATGEDGQRREERNDRWAEKGKSFAQQLPWWSSVGQRGRDLDAAVVLGSCLDSVGVALAKRRPAAARLEPAAPGSLATSESLLPPPSSLDILWTLSTFRLFSVRIVFRLVSKDSASR